MTRERSAFLGLPANILGVAPGLSNKPSRTRVYIVDDVAEEMTRKQGYAHKEHLLGHAMAHEIGHILLNMAGHSHDGIMKATWDRTDMKAMIGGLTFSLAEVARIQEEVAQRSSARDTVQVAAGR